MPTNTVPITPRYVRSGMLKITAAQTDQTGATGANVGTVYTALAAAAPPSDGQGALVQDIQVRVPVTSAAAIVQLFKKTVGGVRTAIGAPIAVTAITVSTTVGGFNSGKIALNEWLLPGESIDALSTIAQETHLSANAAEY